MVALVAPNTSTNTCTFLFPPLLPSSLLVFLSFIFLPFPLSVIIIMTFF
jgi:hypothetical protein